MTSIKNIPSWIVNCDKQYAKFKKPTIVEPLVEPKKVVEPAKQDSDPETETEPEPEPVVRKPRPVVVKQPKKSKKKVVVESSSEDSEESDEEVDYMTQVQNMKNLKKYFKKS